MLSYGVKLVGISESILVRRSLHNTVRNQIHAAYRQSQVQHKRFFWFFRYLTFRTLWQTVRRALQQRLPSLASEMAFNAMLGMFPAILVILTAIGLYPSLRTPFERAALRVSELAPQEVMTLVQNFATEISDSQNRGLFSISFVFAIWASSAAMSAAMRALDQIHQIPPRYARPFWKAKIIALLLTISIIALLVLASGIFLISDIMVKNLMIQSGGALGEWMQGLRQLLVWPLTLLIVSSAFSLLYRFGPSRWIPGKPLVPGALLSALLWAAVSSGFRAYVSHFGNYNKAYGAVGAVIVLLLWLQFSSLSILLGDQLNVIVGETMRSRLRPAKPPAKSKSKSASKPKSPSTSLASRRDSP